MRPLYWIDIDNQTTCGRAEQIVDALNMGLPEYSCCRKFGISRPTLEHIIINPIYGVLSSKARKFNAISRQKERSALSAVQAKLTEIGRRINAKL